MRTDKLEIELFQLLSGHHDSHKVTDLNVFDIGTDAKTLLRMPLYILIRLVHFFCKFALVRTRWTTGSGSWPKGQQGIFPRLQLPVENRLVLM